MNGMTEAQTKKLLEMESKLAYEQERLRTQYLYQFAGQAMQGMVSFGGPQRYHGSLDDVPKKAVKMARALLAELEVQSLET